MRFSERLGFNPIRATLQLDSMNDELKNSLWNVLIAILDDLRDPTVRRKITASIWSEILKSRTDDLHPIPAAERDQLRTEFYRREWYVAYDILEFTINLLSQPSIRVREANRVLAREGSGYRFVGTTLCPISSEEEIASIEESLRASDRFHTARLHIQAAVKLLGNKTSPDYRNCIKESISAVEATCKILSGDPKATLGEALKQLKTEGIELHGAFRDALLKMYGYTSDADGIRHALMEEPNLDFNDAKFMLVTCSAFVNYLVGNST